MKKYLLVIVIGILLLSSVAHASDVSSADYLTTIKVTNNGTALTNQIVVLNLSTAEMIAGGMLNATATDAVMLTGTGGQRCKLWCFSK